MSTINERIAEILLDSGLTKTAFGKRCNVSQQYISKLVKTGVPSDLFISAMCREFGINKEWLMTGHGDKKIKISDEDEFMQAATELRISGDEGIMQAVIEYWKMSPEQREIIKNFIINIGDAYKKGVKEE